MKKQPNSFTPDCIQLDLFDTKTAALAENLIEKQKRAKSLDTEIARNTETYQRKLEELDGVSNYLDSIRRCEVDREAENQQEELSRDTDVLASQIKVDTKERKALSTQIKKMPEKIFNSALQYAEKLAQQATKKQK